MGVEHQAQKRRSRAADAHDERGGRARLGAAAKAARSGGSFEMKESSGMRPKG